MLTIARLDSTDAQLLIEGARRKACDINVPMCIAVTDESGNLIAFERMNGGKAHSISVAQDKAFTAGSSRKATHEYNQACVPGNLVFGIHTAMGGRLCVVVGGLPVKVDDNFVGGVGVSSGTPQQDMVCAQAAIDFFLEHRQVFAQ